MFGRCVMKKLLLIILMMLLLPIVHVSAADTVSFSADNIECKNNRLIEVNLYAKCDKKLSAATFEFGFDKTILEFRGVGKPKGTLVEYNEKSNSVKLSYLCKDGADISSKAAVFTLKFKTISEGFSDITYSVFDCADSDIGQMTIGNCTSGKVTVTSKAPDNIGTEDKSGSSSAKPSKSTKNYSKTSKSAKKSSSSDAGKTTRSESESKDSGTFDSVIQRDFDKATPIIVLCASAVICVTFIGFIVFRIHVIRKAQKRKDD